MPPPPAPTPGRAEFVSYLPDTTQGVVVQPIGKAGVLVAATDTQRGISRLDQARACWACVCGGGKWVRARARELTHSLSHSLHFCLMCLCKRDK